MDVQILPVEAEGNVVSILPSNLSAQIYLDKIKPNKIFKWLYQGV